MNINALTFPTVFYLLAIISEFVWGRSGWDIDGIDIIDSIDARETIDAIETIGTIRPQDYSLLSPNYSLLTTISSLLIALHHVLY